MKFISWNVNGLRACMKKDFDKTFRELDADFFCIQESKLQEGQIEYCPEGWNEYWNYAEKKGDLKNPKTNRKNAGFTDEERGKFTELLDAGFTDSFRYLHPEDVEYSWWSYRFHAREKNAGWRIDYFLTSERVKEKIEQAVIHQEIFGSDHCPVELDISI